MIARTNVQIDTSNFMKAHAMLHRNSKTIPSQALHKSVAFVVRDAKRHTPFTEVSRIDTELSVETTPLLVTQGARKGLPRRDKKTQIAVASKGLAMRIMLARLHRYSNYNILTDMKYALDQASFSPGMGRAGFWARMQLVAQRMVKSRHSSTHFMQVSWNAILIRLANYVPSNYKGAVMTWAGSNGRPPVMDLGEVIPAKPNEPFVSCTIENRLGMDSRYPTISAIRNMESHRILDRVLQISIDRNFHQMAAKLIEASQVELKGPLIAYGHYM